jgi:hypothetical protein
VFPFHALIVGCRFIVVSHISSPVTIRCSKASPLHGITAKFECTFPSVPVCAHL